MAKRGADLIKAIIGNVVKTNSFGRCLKGVKILSAENGNCTAELVITSEHLNEGGTLHGGYTSTLIDCLSTYALLTHEVAAPGVSVDLHVTFMKAARPGELLTIDAKTIRAGRKMAFLAVDLTRNNGKDVIAHGRHTKFIGNR